jgi:hypothetical protein
LAVTGRWAPSRHRRFTAPFTVAPGHALNVALSLRFGVLLLFNSVQSLKGIDVYPEPTLEQIKNPLSKYYDVLEHGKTFINPRREQIQVRGSGTASKT